MLDPKPNLGRAAIEANIEHLRCLRMKAHSEYLRLKRQEQAWREELAKLEQPQ